MFRVAPAIRLWLMRSAYRQELRFVKREAAWLGQEQGPLWPKPVSAVDLAPRVDALISINRALRQRDAKETTSLDADADWLGQVVARIAAVQAGGSPDSAEDRGPQPPPLAHKADSTD
jgi:hypothetical protein